jgi:hypothetical protein
MDSDIDIQLLKAVRIDENHLDRECISLPTLFLQYTHQSAEAKRDVDEAKNELDVVASDTSKEIRDKPEIHGLEKVTEKAVSDAVTKHANYQKALKRVSRAKYRADLAQSVVTALEAKKRTLTLLVELHGMGYFSSPKVSREGREAVEEMTKRKVRRRIED